MKTLAIYGHPTRGKEVIEILEILGGENKNGLNGNSSYLYYIDCNNHITIVAQHPLQTTFIVFRLEEFLEKYPYKIGDKVLLDNQVKVIKGVGWDSKNNEVVYTLETNINGVKTQYQVFNYDLQLYEEDENMNQENETSPQKKINLNHSCFEEYNKVELILPDNWKFKQKDGKIFGVRRKYPKTYEECKLLLQTNCTIPSIPGYREYEIALFQELLICRDAYWKIIGKEMGLSGSWKPNYISLVNNEYFTIHTFNNEIIKSGTSHRNAIIAFPTEEIRDIFFENFKNLIEKCKEFL